MFSVIAYLLVFLSAFFFVCTPFSAYWKQADYVWLVTNGDKFSCRNEGVIIISSAIVSAVQDFVACGLPMILFWKLRIPMKQKFALGGIFSLGFL